VRVREVADSDEHWTWGTSRPGDSSEPGATTREYCTRERHIAGTTPGNSALAGTTFHRHHHSAKVGVTRHPSRAQWLQSLAVDGRVSRPPIHSPRSAVRAGSRYRLQIHNNSDEVIPLHLQRHQAAGERGSQRRRRHRGAQAAG